MNIDEAKQHIDLFVNGSGEHTPLAILVPNFEVKKELREYLEKMHGAKRINNLLVSGASQYFDTKGNLVSDISQRQQRLADGSTFNAAEYLEARAKEYDNPEFKFLYDIADVPTPDMLGVPRYIAQKTGKRLVVIASIPEKGQDILFYPFDTVTVN